MSNKYIGTKSGLIGPVEMDKPEFNKLDLKNKLSILRYNDAASKYIEHLASLPSLPCEGWVPEVGAELVEGVHFRRDELITLEGGKEISRRIVAVSMPAAPQGETTYCETCGPTDRCAEFQQEGSCAYVITRKLFAPATPQLPELDHPEEGAAYLQPAHAAVTDDGEVKETHELKIWPQYFDDVDVDKKPFEVRKTDRLFGIGDILWLREWSPIDGYSGRETRKEITYILHGGQWGITEGNCVMGLKPISQPAPTYPAEFVEWMAQNTLRVGEDKYLLYNKAGSFTKEKIFTEWKRIKSQFK